MLYQSAYLNFQHIVRSETIYYHPASGMETSRIKGLVASFGLPGSEFSIVNPLTGETERHAEIRGGFFDSDAAKEQQGWTDEEHDIVVESLNKLCVQQPTVCARVEQEIYAPVKPWPTYDETHHKTIPVLAGQLGLVELTLAYERENRNREGIIAALEEQLSPREPMPESAPVPAMIGLDG